MDTPLGPHKKVNIQASGSSKCAECHARPEKLCEDNSPGGDRIWKSEIARTGACEQPVKVRAWESAGNSLDDVVYRPHGIADPLPWSHLDTGASNPALSSQWRKAGTIVQGASH